MMDARPDIGPYPSRARSDQHPLFTLPAIAQLSRLYLTPNTPPDDPRASPIATAVLTGVAPTVLVSVGHDPLQDEDLAYAKRLAQAGIPIIHRHEPTLAHGVIDFIGSLPTARELFTTAVDHVLRLLTRRY